MKKTYVLDTDKKATATPTITPAKQPEIVLAPIVVPTRRDRAGYYSHVNEPISREGYVIGRDC